MVNRDIEDAIYDQVAAELANNDVQPGLMAKAAAKSKGDNNVAKSLYIELRAEQLARHLNRAAREHQGERRRPPLPAPSRTLHYRPSQSRFQAVCLPRSADSPFASRLSAS